jgi:hypothetical protein
MLALKWSICEKVRWQEKSGTSDQEEENVDSEGNSVTEKLKSSQAI